jgi:predicted O-methyltransferase YrrM
MKPGKILLQVSKTYDTVGARGRREMFINDLVKHFSWTTGAEIGVRTGSTSFYLLNNNPNLVMWAADKDISQFYNDQVKQTYQTRLKVLEGVSWEVAAQVPDGSLDFYFIDAGHSYKSVIKDIDAWTPKLKPNGWFIGHDINFPAVNRAVAERFPGFQVGPDNVWFKAPDNNYSILKKCF